MLGAVCYPTTGMQGTRDDDHARPADTYPGTIKVGFAGNMYPKARVPCVVEKLTIREEGCNPGKRPYKPVLEMEWYKDCVENAGYVNPCVNGVVCNWEAMRVVLEHAFSRLQVRSTNPGNQRSQESQRVAWVNI
jgi:actin-related protein